MKNQTCFLACLVLLCLSGCAASESPVMTGLNNKFDRLVEFKSRMRDDLKQYNEEGSEQDKRIATLLDTVRADIGVASAKVAELRTHLGAVSQQFGQFKGKQNAGWFSGGGFWAALVAVSAFYLIPSPLQRRRKNS